MKIKLEDFNDKGEITKELVCKSLSEAKEKAVGKKFYRVHRCFHDEVPWKPCVVEDQIVPVVVDEVVNKSNEEV